MKSVRDAAAKVSGTGELRRELLDRIDQDAERIRSLEARVDQLELALAAETRARESTSLLDGEERDIVVQRALLTNLVESTPVALRELARRIEAAENSAGSSR